MLFESIASVELEQAKETLLWSLEMCREICIVEQEVQEWMAQYDSICNTLEQLKLTGQPRAKKQGEQFEFLLTSAQVIDSNGKNIIAAIKKSNNPSLEQNLYAFFKKILIDFERLSLGQWEPIDEDKIEADLSRLFDADKQDL